MFKKLLVACDDSEGANIALAHSAILAGKLGAELTAVWVRDSLPHFPETVDEIAQEEESAQKFFRRVVEQINSVSARERVMIRAELRKGNPAKQIVDLAREGSFDLVILGQRGHSRLWGELLGHTADRVTEHAPCSVLIVRSQLETALYRKMLVGFDGSSGSMLALEQALELAAQLGSEVEVLWIHPTAPGPYTEADEQRANIQWAQDFFETSIRDTVEQAATRHDVRATVDYRVGIPAIVLDREAELGGFRIVAVGQHGQSGLWGRLLGGTADRVSHHAPCDVLVARERQRE